MFGKWKKILKKPDPEKEKTLRDEIEQAGGLEKGDMPAMVLSAFLVFIPVAAIALALFVGLAMLFLQ